MRKRHWDDVQPLRDEMFKKRQEMRDLFTNPGSTDGAILAKQTELNKLQQTMRDKMVQFKLEQRKVFTPDQLEKMKDLPYGHRQGRRQGYGRAEVRQRPWIWTGLLWLSFKKRAEPQPSFSFPDE